MNGPNVADEFAISKVFIRHVAIAIVAPGFAPGVANNEMSLAVVISDSHHGVTTKIIGSIRHRDHTIHGVGEIFSDQSTEDERETHGKALTHFIGISILDTEMR